jgi:hypothetical protein
MLAERGLHVSRTALRIEGFSGLCVPLEDPACEARLDVERKGEMPRDCA